MHSWQVCFIVYNAHTHAKNVEHMSPTCLTYVYGWQVFILDALSGYPCNVSTYMHTYIHTYRRIIHAYIQEARLYASICVWVSMFAWSVCLYVCIYVCMYTNVSLKECKYTVQRECIVFIRMYVYVFCARICVLHTHNIYIYMHTYSIHIQVYRHSREYYDFACKYVHVSCTRMHMYIYIHK